MSEYFEFSRHFLNLHGQQKGMALFFFSLSFFFYFFCPPFLLVLPSIFVILFFYFVFRFQYRNTLTLVVFSILRAVLLSLRRPLNDCERWRLFHANLFVLLCFGDTGFGMVL